VLWLERADAPEPLDAAAFPGVEAWSIRTQIDRLGMDNGLAAHRDEFVSEGFDSHSKGFGPRHAISVRTGSGLTALLADLTRFAERLAGQAGDGLVAHERQRTGIEAAREALSAALAARELGLEFVAEHVRAAAHAIGKVTGVIDVEDVLGAIFATFCIGK
jgi:tRNA modification GTPase